MNRLVVYIFFILQCLTISANAYKCGDVYQLSVCYNENMCGVDDEDGGEYCDFSKFINTTKLCDSMKSGVNDEDGGEYCDFAKFINKMELCDSMKKVGHFQPLAVWK